MNSVIVQNVFSNIAFAVLMLSMICSWINLIFFNETNILSKISNLSGWFVIGCLIFILSSRWIIAGYFPLSNLYESLLFLTCLALFVCLYMENKTKKKVIGVILTPVTLLIYGFANLTLSAEMQKSSPLVPALQSNWLMLHVSMMLLSYATLIMGSLLCILFLIKSRGKDVNLKVNVKMGIRQASAGMIANQALNNSSTTQINYIEKIIDYLFKLNIFQFLDNCSYRIIGLGYPFLTMGIISGAVWANEAWGSYWSWDPKETWALITWIVFTSYLHARLVKGWEDTKSAMLGGLGFFAIWICYLGVNFLGKGLHAYGWFS